MEVIEFVDDTGELSPRQRWGHILTIVVGIVGIAVGFLLRDNALNATVEYVDSQAGIRVEYPLNWLLDTTGNYVFRIRDVSRLEFKTTFQVAVRPINTDNPNGRNILDALSLERSQILPAYNVSVREPYLLPNDVLATSMRYSYVSTEANSLLENVPTVVLGLDLLTIKRGQAIIITFQADSRIFDEEFQLFSRFLSSMDF